MKRLGFLVCLVILLWATAGSAGAREVVLRYGYITGESRTYGLGVAGTGSVSLAGFAAPLEFSLTSAMTQKCQTIAEDGAMEIETVSSPSSVAASFAGQPVDLGGIPSQEMRMAYRLYPDGRVEVTQTPASSPGAPFGVLGIQIDPYDLVRSATSARLPTEAVGEGSKWTTQVPVPLPGGKTGQLTANSTIAGFEPLEGIDCVLIDTEFTLPLSLEFTGLGIAFEGWAAGRIREAATVEQMKTVSQTGQVSLFLSTATPGEEATGEALLLGPGVLSNISLTVNASCNLHLQQ